MLRDIGWRIHLASATAAVVDARVLPRAALPVIVRGTKDESSRQRKHWEENGGCQA